MDNSLKLTELKPEVLVRILKQAGCRTITLEELNLDLDMGAPKNGDGTINLITYAAWQCRDKE